MMHDKLEPETLFDSPDSYYQSLVSKEDSMKEQYTLDVFIQKSKK